MTAALNATRRATELAALADGAPVDVVVIGGGITGAGIALDAVTRGLAVVLVGDRPTAPVADGIDVTRAEFEYAVTHEGAMSVDDILDRRTRIGLVDQDRERGRPAAEEMLSLLG